MPKNHRPNAMIVIASVLLYIILAFNTIDLKPTNAQDASTLDAASAQQATVTALMGQIQLTAHFEQTATAAAQNAPSMGDLQSTARAALTLTAQGASSSRSGKIAATSNRSGKFQIYIMNSNGSGQQRLTTTVEAYWPAWSPDGTRLAFSGGVDGQRDIYVMNADGSDQRRLTTNRAENGFPAWSSDGRRILFNTGGNIFLMNADGTGRRQVTYNVANSYWPTWSPDGQRILFVGGRDPDRRDVFSMRLDGSDLINLTNNAAADDIDAVYSPDGKTIVFASNRSGNYELYAIAPDGRNLRRLTSSAGDELHASWSPDGQSLVFIYNPSAPFSRLGYFDRDQFYNGQWELYLMRNDGSNRIQITSNLSDADSPDWLK